MKRIILSAGSFLLILALLLAFAGLTALAEDEENYETGDLTAWGVQRYVGITDVLAKSKGSSNPHNLVKATIAALGEMRSPMQVAQHRGVSLDKVFNG